MNRTGILLLLLPLFLGENSVAQNVETVYSEESFEKIHVMLYKKKTKDWYDGDSIQVYYIPELPVYAPLKFTNHRQIARYNRLVRNVKRTLPLAKKVNAIIKETYEVLELLPDAKSRQEHINKVEKGIRAQYEPEMKKLTYSQGKLLIKLIDRECNQSSYEIVKAFFGQGKAIFYQIFAFTFRASLKKKYNPETDDRLIERVVRQVEAGVL